MAQRLSFRGLKCPKCGYSLEGLPEAVCPECGNRFNPDWLYSVEYANAFQWSARRRFVVWGLAALIGCALVVLALRAGGEFVCMMIAAAGVATILVVRRLYL